MLLGVRQHALEQTLGSADQSVWPDFAELAVETTKLMHFQQQTRSADASVHVDDPATQTETVRKMLLGFSRDVRVVLLRLALAPANTGWYCRNRNGLFLQAWLMKPCSVLAPLANRLGIWQIKWETGGFSFRFFGARYLPERCAAAR